MKEIGQDLSDFNCGLAHVFCESSSLCKITLLLLSFSNCRLRKWFFLFVFAFLAVQHTSASLTINENYDPDVQADTETFLNRIVPEV